MKKPQLPNIPEFSDKNYKIIGYVVGGLTTLCGVFFIYEIFADGDLTFKAQWNMFKSPLGNLCLFIGFFWLTPYMNSTMANFYEEVKQEYEQGGVTEATIIEEETGYNKSER